MSGYRLPPHVGFGLVEEEPVFLDLERDRYYRLEPKARAEFLALLDEDGGKGRSVALGGRLVATGLLLPQAGLSGPAPAACPPVTRSALDMPLARAWPSPGLVAECWWRLGWARRQLRRGRLAALVARLGAGKRRTGRSDVGQARAGSLAARFIAASRMVPIAPDCLADSLALGFFLARRNIFPELVFGAKLNPFAAHCWLQDDALLLNDSLGTIEEFVPVFIV